MKALYLDGRRETSVRFDGPALRVQTAGRADGRYPLGRISRIVTIGRVTWHPQALLACFQFGVPLAELDSRGRFVRLRFALAEDASGLARHLGELIATGRYRGRFERWWRAADRQARAPVLQQYGIRDRGDDGERAWQAAVQAQARMMCCRPGRYHAFLSALAMAHLVSIFARLGLPADPGLWTRPEYRLLQTFLRLERWYQVEAVSRLLGSGNSFDRRALIEMFEREAGAREERITRWRQQLLLALLGIDHRETDMTGVRDREENHSAERMPPWLQHACNIARCTIGGNASWLPHPTRDSLRSGAKLLRTWLQYDRGCHEPF